MAVPYDLPAEVATVLAQIATWRNSLPQGAPTSPIIANMICSRMDTQLQRLARRNNCRYTRYADDLTFSTLGKRFPGSICTKKATDQGEIVEPGAELRRLIEDNGFMINSSKVRLQAHTEHQEVTGITVNKFPNVDRRFVRQIRAMLHAWAKYGHEAAQAEYLAKYDFQGRRGPYKEKPKFSIVVKGKIDFLSMVRGKTDPIYQNFLGEFNRLQGGRKKKAVHLKPPEIMSQLWILECESDCYQGTAFDLDGVGTVTCAHVLERNSKAFRSYDTATKYPVKVTHKDEDLDLAVLIVEGAPTGPAFKAGDPGMLKVLEPVSIAGFPNYRTFDSGVIRVGEIAGFRYHASIRRIMLSCSVVAGTSGSPILNRRNEIVGVAVTGADREDLVDKTENHAAIPIDALKHFGFDIPSTPTA